MEAIGCCSAAFSDPAPRSSVDEVLPRVMHVKDTTLAAAALAAPAVSCTDNADAASVPAPSPATKKNGLGSFLGLARLIAALPGVFLAPFAKIWHCSLFLLGHAIARSLNLILVPFFGITGRSFMVCEPVLRPIFWVTFKVYFTYAIVFASLRRLVRDSSFDAVRYSRKHWEVNAGADPEALSHCSNLIRGLGYAAEEHTVVTKDGYVLTVHRMRPGDADPMGQAVPRHNFPVLLWHALLMCSDVWLLNDRKRNLACVLCDAGFDVWLANGRGSVYSQRHLVHTPSVSSFWDYGVDEIAVYDVPATIHYLLGHTGQKKLVYIGHSQGSANGFMSFCCDPALADKVSVFVGLAPAIVPARMPFSIIEDIVRLPPEYLYLMFGCRQIFPSLNHVGVALGNRMLGAIMKWFLLYLFRWESRNIVDTKAMLPHLFSGGSVRNCVHWFQMFRKGGLYKFDFGRKENLLRYGIVEPPPYDASGIKFPVVLVHGSADTVPNIEETIGVLPGVVHVICVKGWEHLDPIWARDVDTKMIPDLMTFIHQYAPHIV